MAFDWTPHKGGKWKPEKPGDRIEGRVVAIEERDGRDGSRVVVVLRDREGVNRDVWCTTDLLAKLSDLEPQPGDALQITLKELRATGQPQKLKVFEVRHKRASELGDGAAPKSTVSADELAEQRDLEEPF